jgi:hypothetical protein
VRSVSEVVVLAGREKWGFGWDFQWMSECIEDRFLFWLRGERIGGGKRWRWRCRMPWDSSNNISSRIPDSLCLYGIQWNWTQQSTALMFSRLRLKSCFPARLMFAVSPLLILEKPVNLRCLCSRVLEQKLRGSRDLAIDHRCRLARCPLLVFSCSLLLPLDWPGSSKLSSRLSSCGLQT